MLNNIRLATIFVFISFMVVFLTHTNQIDVGDARKGRLVEASQDVVVKTKREIEHTRKMIQCLALNIYFEANGEPLLGQIAVARVVMNRVRDGRFPSNPCSVIYQSTEVVDPETNESKRVCQFSWVCQDPPTPKMSNEAYKQALAIAKGVILENKWSDIIDHDVLFFHNISVNPGWNLQHVITIGRHKFFNDNKKVVDKK